ncbi:MAG: hypothetical protein IT431_17445 [Phycisphaerales bacterium]|nr:hypothetical protein [Phycisphaerales bacterium]
MRILHIGLGPLGRMIARDVHTRALGRVVAAIDPHPELAGRPLADLVEGADPAVTVAPSLDAQDLPRPIDAAIVTTSSDLAKCAPTFRLLLSHGMTVVSTCEELIHPGLRHPQLAAELDQLAKAHAGRLLGTGVNPGFLMDTLPALASAACRTVRHAEVWRVQDASTRRVRFQQKIGAGHTDERFAARVADGSLRHVGLGESLHFLAEALGWTIARWEESLEPVRTAQPLRCELGDIGMDGIAGVRQVATGWDAAGLERVRLEFVAAIGQADPHDRVRLDSDPPIDLMLRGGLHGDRATCATTLNVIEPLMAAPPGLHTMRTIGMPSCRYHLPG